MFGVGYLAIAPTFVACKKTPPAVGSALSGVLPKLKPADWDPVAFNLERGLAGSIPESYHAAITSPDGVEKHVGKHLPYVPRVPERLVPDGFIPIMWGDPSKGYAKHPNAAPSDANGGQGHWYNWIRIRKAVQDAPEEETTFVSWPEVGSESTGSYVVMGNGDIREDGGRNTIYLAARPHGVRTGDVVRVHAHCLTHGEWVDFITV